VPRQQLLDDRPLPGPAVAGFEAARIQLARDPGHRSTVQPQPPHLGEHGLFFRVRDEEAAGGIERKNKGPSIRPGA